MSSTAPRPRKELILELAERHFAEHGFQGGSLSAIAREAGIQNPGLLHHYPSKEHLYRAVLEEQARDLAARMHRRLAKADSLAQRLTDFIAVQVEWMRVRPAGFRLITRELLDNSERMKTAQTRPLESFLQEAQTLLQQAQATGLVRKDVSWLFALTLILGTLNYAKIVRPTLVAGFADEALKTDKRWMAQVQDDVLRVLRP